MVELSPGTIVGRAGRKKEERPDSFLSSTVGIVIPPGGPNVADCIPDSICGDDVECFRERRCRIGGSAGELGTSSVVREMKSVVFVLRLSWLGLRFMEGIMGLMKQGEAGSDSTDGESELNGGWMKRPFMFLGRLGAGEVMGRSRFGPDTDKLAMLDNPKGAGAKPWRGAKLTGESGDEDGEGSERSDESAHDTVVVGDESADSVVCVDVLSLCLWAESEGKAPGPNPGCEPPNDFASSKTNLWSTIVTVFDWSMSSLSRS